MKIKPKFSKLFSKLLFVLGFIGFSNLENTNAQSCEPGHGSPGMIEGTTSIDVNPYISFEDEEMTNLEVDQSDIPGLPEHLD